MTYWRSGVNVFIDGVYTPHLSLRTNHGVDYPIGDCVITLPLPHPSHLGGDPVGKVIEVQATQRRLTTAGAPASVEAGVIFQGVIRDQLDEMSVRGQRATYRAQSWLYLLSLPGFEDVAWRGPIWATSLIWGLLAAAGYSTTAGPRAYVDAILWPDNAHLILGGNPDVDDEQVRLPAGTSPLAFARRIVELAGYRVFDTPSGTSRVTRVQGAPPDPEDTQINPYKADGGFRTIRETEEGFRLNRAVSTRGIVTYWEVLGASWRDEEGTESAIRSFPASVPSNPDVPTPPGAIHRRFTDNLLISNEMADQARNIREIDSGGRGQEADLTLDGKPRLYPGHVVEVDAPTVGLAGTYRVMSVSHSHDARSGLRTTTRVRRGAGEPLDPGQDLCIEELLLTGPVHVGDEFVGWYAVPSPSGFNITVDFEPLEDYTSINISGRAHGSNSQFIDGANANLTVSRFILEQPVGTQIGEGPMPVLDENYALQLDYTNDANWADFVVPLPGSLAGGVGARLRLVSGENPALPEGTKWDDFEVKNVVLTNCAQGQPDLPTTPTNPTIPPPQAKPPTSCFWTAGGGTASQGNSPIDLATVPFPANEGYNVVVLTGTVSGASGLDFDGNLDFLHSSPEHGIQWFTRGSYRPFYAAGSVPREGSGEIGTVISSGPFERVWKVAPTNSAVNARFRMCAMRRFPLGTPATPVTVSNLCWKFYRPGEVW